MSVRLGARENSDTSSASGASNTAMSLSFSWRGSKIYNPVNDCVRLGEKRVQSYISCSPKTNLCILSISFLFPFFEGGRGNFLFGFPSVV